MSDREQRKAQRSAYPCEVEIYGTGSGKADAARIRVLSLRGAFVETSSPLPVGTRLTVRFVLPLGPIVLAGEVAHSIAEGMGIHFLALTRAQHAALQKALEEKA
jgi:PilZ domain